MNKVLVIGANGQLGSELVVALREKFGTKNVLATDINPPKDKSGPFEILDIMDEILELL